MMAYLPAFNLHFPRDQDYKVRVQEFQIFLPCIYDFCQVYIQHKIEEDKNDLYTYLKQDRGNFYLCGPTWPVPDVRKAITNGFVANGMEDKEAADFLQKLKDDERYVLEVY